MGTLKSSDILGELNTKVEGNSERFEKRRIAEEYGASKPSPYTTDLRAKLRDKVQFNIGKIPRFIFDDFEKLVSESGMNKREYFYHLLREKGVDIPPYEEMDGRKL